MLPDSLPSSALTAAMSTSMRTGRAAAWDRFANPSSDSIYQRIGYRAVSDVDFWAFSG